MTDTEEIKEASKQKHLSVWWMRKHWQREAGKWGTGHMDDASQR